jgi:hypothetical protein
MAFTVEQSIEAVHKYCKEQNQKLSQLTYEQLLDVSGISLLCTNMFSGTSRRVGDYQHEMRKAKVNAKEIQVPLRASKLSVEVLGLLWQTALANGCLTQGETTKQDVATVIAAISEELANEISQTLAAATLAEPSENNDSAQN